MKKIRNLTSYELAVGFQELYEDELDNTLTAKDLCETANSLIKNHYPLLNSNEVSKISAEIINLYREI